MGVLLDNILKTNTDKKGTATTKQTKTETTPKQEFETFDISKIKSTVKNPSTKFKGISVEDEQKIMDIVNKQFGKSSKFEQQQAIQGLYNSALKAQKKKDIEAGRDEVKLQYINNKNNAKNSKEKNTWNQQIKKADLADLIKDQLGKEGYKTDDFMNITDNGIIKGFVDENPEYADAFNKYFYNEKSAESLGKELGWLEKTTGDKLMDKIKGLGEGVKGWMDKFGEGVDDLLGMATESDYLGNKGSSAWINYVQDKYGVAPVNLTDEDYKQARADFLKGDKTAYQPTISSAVTKLMEGGSDIAFTTYSPATLLWKSGFSAANQTPGLQKVPEFIGGTMGEIGGLINELPVAKNIRNSLQTEQEKADWDAFVGGGFLGKWTKIGKWKNNIKNIDAKTLKSAYSDFKQGKNGFETVKKGIEENRKADIQEQKEAKAQQISQGQIETKGAAAKGLDALAEQDKLSQFKLSNPETWVRNDNIKSVADLERNTNDVISKLKEQQTQLAQEKGKKFGKKDLVLEETADIIDKNTGKKTTTTNKTTPIETILDDIIDHYENVDSTEALKYKSYKDALNKGNLPQEVILDIRRESNSINQKVYNNKTNQHSDTKKANKWAKDIEKVNKLIENLDIGEEIRAMDSKLNGLYTLQNGLKEIKKAEANFKKKAIQDGTLDSVAKSLGAFVSRVLGKLSFGGTNLAGKAAVSALQETLGGRGFTKETYNSAEIANKIPEFISEYKDLLKKMEGKDVTKNMANKMLRAWMDKWESTMQYNDVEEDKE